MSNKSKNFFKGIKDTSPLMIPVVPFGIIFGVLGTLIPAEVTSPKSLENKDLGTITGNFIKQFPIGSKVKLLVQPEDLHHDDKSNLKFEVIDRKFRGTNFIYTLKTPNNMLIPVFVHSHHIHQHEVDEKFGIKRPIHIDHIVCF